MGVTISVTFDPDKYEGKLFMPKQKLVPFPSNRCRPPCQLVTYFRALPPSLKLPPESDTLFWWVDCQFLPYHDNELCCSVGAYTARPGRTPIPVSTLIKGLVYTIKFSNRLSCSVIKGTSSGALPKVSVHPDGQRVSYVGSGCITLLDLPTQHSLIKNKDGRNNNYQYTAISPNGVYIATLARLSKDFELSILLIDVTFLLLTERYECNMICPGFRGTQQYTEQVECKFSPDSKAVAVGSSFGMLFIVNRGRHQKHMVVVGTREKAMFDINDAKLSSARAFDYDPRYLQRMMAFASVKNVVYVCDVIDGIIQTEIRIDTRSIDCLQYCPLGPHLAVATSEAQVLLYNPDTGNWTFTLDGTAQGPEASLRSLNGIYPTILRMSFTKAGDHMVMGSTDGVIRIWQLKLDISLQNICRKVILRHVNGSDLAKLPLPAKIVLYLVQWPTQR